MSDEPRDGRKRLVVELSERADVALTEMVLREGLNKTTIVNRAIQVYRMVMEAESVVIDGKGVRIV